MRVLVVGAGLGGLTAAMRLQENGAEVTVFEARDRAGGRVWSHRFDNGTVVELGGEWIDSTQNAVTDLAADLGLSMFDTRQDFVTRDLIGSEPIPDEEHANLARRVVAAMEGLGNERLETMSIAALLDSLQVTSPAMAVLRSRLEGTMGVPLTEISAADLGEEFGLTQASTYLRVQGGNDRLAREMASRLDVRLGTPVHAVGQGETSASVTTDEANVAADHVVVAVPLPILRRPGFLDSPPPAFRGAIDGIGMGTAVKVAVATVDQPPMFRRQERDIPGWYWTGAGPDGSTRRAVTGFAGTDRGAAVLTAEVESRLRRAVPETGLDGDHVVVDWGADPWAGGCYTALGPGQRAHLPELQRPWGRIVFAGEHVNGTGTIDGAIRSGHLAAELLLEG
jgi:monoamine oxidase